MNYNTYNMKQIKQNKIITEDDVQSTTTFKHVLKPIFNDNTKIRRDSLTKIIVRDDDATTTTSKNVTALAMPEKISTYREYKKKKKYMTYSTVDTVDTRTQGKLAK